MPKKPRKSAKERLARDRKNLIHDREKLFRLSRGGSPELPIEVPTSSVIEVRATSQRCPQCDGAYVIEDHTAEKTLRAVHVRCQTCATRRQIWFEIRPSGRQLVVARAQRGYTTIRSRPHVL